jgi:molybdopterin-guanine dinucleotide biosynthesis protein A
MASVFMSHRGPDKAPATRLAESLRDAGHDVWLDVWEIELGDSIIAKIDQGLSGAAYVVLCLADAGVDAPFISREWMATLARQLDGAGVKLLPVRLTGGVPPAILADIRYADLVADWDAGIHEVLRAIR